MTTIPTFPNLLTIRETARVLRVSRSTVYRLAEEKGLPTIHIGGSVRVDSDQLAKWIYGGDGDEAA
jgi:excisionase family DNA binding protein